MKKAYKRKLLECSDDAAFKQMMAEYSEAEGARLFQEYQDAIASGETPPMPEELDQKYRRLLNREFARQRREALVSQLRKLSERAAVALIAGAWYHGGSNAKSNDILSGEQKRKADN